MRTDGRAGRDELENDAYSLANSLMRFVVKVSRLLLFSGARGICRTSHATFSVWVCFV